MCAYRLTFCHEQATAVLWSNAHAWLHLWLCVRVCMPRPDTGPQAAEAPPEPVSVYRPFPEPPLFSDGDHDQSRGSSRGSICCESSAAHPAALVEVPDAPLDVGQDATRQLSPAVSTDMHSGGEQRLSSSEPREEALEWSPPECSGRCMLLAASKQF